MVRRGHHDCDCDAEGAAQDGAPAAALPATIELPMSDRPATHQGKDSSWQVKESDSLTSHSGQTRLVA